MRNQAKNNIYAYLTEEERLEFFGFTNENELYRSLHKPIQQLSLTEVMLLFQTMLYKENGEEAFTQLAQQLDDCYCFDELQPILDTYQAIDDKQLLFETIRNTLFNLKLNPQCQQQLSLAVASTLTQVDEKTTTTAAKNTRKSNWKEIPLEDFCDFEVRRRININVHAIIKSTGRSLVCYQPLQHAYLAKVALQIKIEDDQFYTTVILHAVKNDNAFDAVKELLTNNLSDMCYECEENKTNHQMEIKFLSMFNKNILPLFNTGRIDDKLVKCLPSRCVSYSAQDIIKLFSNNDRNPIHDPNAPCQEVSAILKDRTADNDNIDRITHQIPLCVQRLAGLEQQYERLQNNILALMLAKDSDNVAALPESKAEYRKSAAKIQEPSQLQQLQKKLAQCENSIGQHRQCLAILQARRDLSTPAASHRSIADPRLFQPISDGASTSGRVVLTLSPPPEEKGSGSPRSQPA